MPEAHTNAHHNAHNHNDGTVTVENGYAVWSEHYDSFSNPMTYIVEKHLADMLDMNTSTTGPVLELGCGTGRNLAHMIDLGLSEGIGMDISEDMLNIARQKIQNTSFSVTRHNLNEALPQASGSIGTVLISLVLEHIQDIDRVISEAARVLVPGGQLIIFEIHPFQRLNGRRAHYQDESGEDQFLPSYPHLIKDYVGAAKTAGLLLEHMEEYRSNPELEKEFPKLARYGDMPIVLGLKFRRAF
ncbi:class I SAM-dependent methyltransferase [Hahella ganghwensis]|uniref:class I SAM-dependent methyltransferase n=1 Tax=Hahella ganghwensis TaxID=286420 RepID=UPI00035DA541|nr:class I SAM-dependent methyltransferase [Hahella ganghwensis]